MTGSDPRSESVPLTTAATESPADTTASELADAGRSPRAATAARGPGGRTAIGVAEAGGSTAGVSTRDTAPLPGAFLAGWIRRAVPSDRDALYRVCVLTGDAGQDATGQYRYPELLGDVFVGPYLALEPAFAFVLDGGDGAEGYVLGALDSAAFDERCERGWWPERRADYAAVGARRRVAAGSRDAWLLDWIDSPPPVPAEAKQYPSHLHIDTLPRWHGGGWGRRLLDTVCSALAAGGSPGVHLGVSLENDNAIGFYRHYGFTDLSADGDSLLMGLLLA